MKLFSIYRDWQAEVGEWTAAFGNETAALLARLVISVLRANAVSNLRVIDYAHYDDVSSEFTGGFRYGQSITFEDLTELVAMQAAVESGAGASGFGPFKIRDDGCRFIQFGHDLTLYLCLRHEDVIDHLAIMMTYPMFTVEDVSTRLINSDVFDN